MSAADPPDSSDELDPEAVAFFKQGAKALMRKRFRALRKAVPLSGIEARSRSIIERLEGLDVIRNARSIALFEPIVARHEVDLRAFDASLRSRGVTVFYPSIDPATRIMLFREVADREAMEERGLGFRDPGENAPIAEHLDVVIVPALAVDGRGHRLGYGAGFYDRALPRYVPPARAIAVAFDFQLAVEVPDTEGDFRVDQIVTDTKTLDVGLSRA